MINNLIRQIQIDLITNDTNPIVEWFNNLWNKLDVIKTNVYHINCGEIVYYLNGNRKQYIFYQDDENDRFWCNSDHYWKILINDFNLNYNEIQTVTKLLVENALNKTVATPVPLVTKWHEMVENSINNSSNAVSNTVIVTPTELNGSFERLLENALNN